MDNTARYASRPQPVVAHNSVRGFTLPTLPNTSTSSLMDAVVGGNRSLPHPSPKTSTPFTLGRLNEEPAALGDASASARVNRAAEPAEKEDVRELEVKVQKR